MTKTKLDTFLEKLSGSGWDPGLKRESYASILASGVNSKNWCLASIAGELAANEHPITLRGLLYRCVSVGILPDTEPKQYNRLGRLLSRLRESGVIPFEWIVDNLRMTDKPSSWSGLNEFVGTVRDAYRKDFWASLPEYVHIFCEKDAIAGTIAPVTHDFDVPLSPIRGYVSLSYAHEIAQQWDQIDKPIFAYYVGDYDASGFDLERDLKDKLKHYCGTHPYFYGPMNDFFDLPRPSEEYLNRSVRWERLAVCEDDFEEHELIELKPKRKDSRYQAFVEEHGDRCAEVDAIPPNVLRERIRDAIQQHVPQDRWESLQRVEQAEKETVVKVLNSLSVES